jgi:hypothetical protein
MYSWIFWCAFALILTRSALAWQCLRRRGIGHCDNVSVIIPLRGWDEGLPQLVRDLPGSYKDGDVEIIVVIDDDNPRRVELNSSSSLRLIPPDPPSSKTLDKNLRLETGVRHARFSTIMLVDSDVCVDTNFLSRRLDSHAGDISFSLPLYAYPKTMAESFLAAFTAYSNLTIYAAAFGAGQIATAIGPCMVCTDREALQLALEQGRQEIADDHAIGYHFAMAGKAVHCAAEPVVVQYAQATWKDSLEQIVRWMCLPRTVGHLRQRRAFLALLISSFIGCIPLLMLLAAAVDFAFVRTHWQTWLSMSLGIALSEGFIIALIQRYALRRRAPPAAWSNLLWVAAVLYAQPFLFVYSRLKSRVRWRGQNLAITGPK